MKIFLARWFSFRRVAATTVVVVLLAAGGFAIGLSRSPELRRWTTAMLAEAHGDEQGHGDEHGHEEEGSSTESHEGHDDVAPAESAADDGHDHEAEKPSDHAHLEAEAVNLSSAAQENVGLKLAAVEVGPFERTLTVPAMIVERPGRSVVHVAAPLTGVVTRIWCLQGETVTPGQPLFDLRLTHEEIVQAQSEFLQTAESLDVAKREIVRLERVTAEGAVAGKTLLERSYEQQKLQGVFRAQRQRLLLHGLSEKQIDEIVAKRTLLASLTVTAPEPSDPEGKSESPRPLQVQELKVTKGQHVEAGNSLCALVDHTSLYIQGKAFEQDMDTLNKAVGSQWPVTAVFNSQGGERQTVPNLSIVYLADRIEPESRALLFYVQIPNELLRDQKTPDGHRYGAWKYKPGQRLELLVPVERLPDRIVLPLNAVVQDGAESYVFEKNNGHFDRRAVRVEYRDQLWAVLANDGALKHGKEVIVSGAYQVHLAMKNKAGGGPDPHAGHNH